MTTKTAAVVARFGLSLQILMILSAMTLAVVKGGMGVGSLVLGAASLVSTATLMLFLYVFQKQTRQP